MCVFVYSTCGVSVACVVWFGCGISVVLCVVWCGWGWGVGGDLLVIFAMFTRLSASSSKPQINTYITWLSFHWEVGGQSQT